LNNSSLLLPRGKCLLSSHASSIRLILVLQRKLKELLNPKINNKVVAITGIEFDFYYSIYMILVIPGKLLNPLSNNQGLK
jgi:hypothetical protein